MNFSKYENAASKFSNANELTMGLTHSAMGTGAVGELDSNASTLTFTITNASTSASATAYIFAAEYDPANSLNSGLTVAVSESSYTQLKYSLIGGEAFIVSGARYLVTAAAQFSNAWTIVERNAFGALEQRTVAPLSYRSNLVNVSTQIDMYNFRLKVTKNTYITFTVNASESITIIFNVSRKLKVTNALVDAPAMLDSKNKTIDSGMPVSM
jgi:hypothetical protein